MKIILNINSNKTYYSRKYTKNYGIPILTNFRIIHRRT